MKYMILVRLLCCMLLLSCSKSDDNGDPDPGDNPGDTTTEPLPFASLPSTQASFTLSATEDYVNVMGSKLKKLPPFRKLERVSGKAIGYVKDTYGMPIQNAHMGVRSTLIGGAYSSASATTNEKGYYEILLPVGTADFFAGGYTIDYGEGRAAVTLYPADGHLNSFPSTDGVVKNFVLMPYGKCDPDAVSENPGLSSNYMGGAIYIHYHTAVPNDPWALPGSLPENGDVEVTLTPEEYLFDAEEKKSFTIVKKLVSPYFKILNIPIGKYRISAKLVAGNTALRLKATGYNPMPIFGLKPTEAIGNATLWLIPEGAVSNTIIPFYGTWKSVEIQLELP